jgi:hypothetical protein
MNYYYGILIFGLLVYMFNYSLVKGLIHPGKRWSTFSTMFVMWHVIEAVIAIIVACIVLLLGGWGPTMELFTSTGSFLSGNLLNSLYLLFIPVFLFLSSGLLRYMLYDRRTGKNADPVK